MIKVIEGVERGRPPELLDQMFRIRAEVFADSDSSTTMRCGASGTSVVPRSWVISTTCAGKMAASIITQATPATSDLIDKDVPRQRRMRPRRDKRRATRNKYDLSTHIISPSGLRITIPSRHAGLLPSAWSRLNAGAAEDVQAGVASG